MGEKQSDLWRYVADDEYSPPTEPTGETVRSSLRELWHRFRPPRPAPPTSGTQTDLRSMPVRLLDLAVPALTWDQATSVLEKALKPWRDGGPPIAVIQMVVGSPGSGVARVVTRLAEGWGWQVTHPPLPTQVFEGGSEWLAGVKGGPGTPLVIPRLARCYFRHQDGLDLMRRLLEWLSTADRCCLIGCDRWGLAFLDKSLEAGAILSSRLALEAFDARRFERWFARLCAGCRVGLLRFHHAETREEVLSVANGGTEESGSGEPGAAQGVARGAKLDFMQHLAGRSRGIPGIGWAIWRHSLQIPRAEDVEWERETSTPGENGRTIWVQPWSRLCLPLLPGEARTPEAFVLHSLLLHAGLPAELLPPLLPLGVTQITKSLHGLRAAGLIEEEAGLWRVTALGYPAVRQFLRNDGYLVDAF